VGSIAIRTSEELEGKELTMFFSKLNKSLQLNIRGVSCAAHVVHNLVQTRADILPVNVETFVNKIFQYFHIYILMSEELKEFCTFVDTEYKEVLGSVKPGGFH
jgi:hypothetical protein